MFRCKEIGCNIKYACFNLPGEKQGLYCVTHKEANMINVINKKCKYENCLKSPNYNYIQEKTPLYCVKHKLENMVNITSKTCIFNCCRIQPHYNYKDEKKPLYCVKHKLENMIDIKNKVCIFEDCKIQPHYNYENEKIPLYCLEHKLDKMIDIKHKTCIFIGCKIRPNYNYENEKIPLYCKTHKLENMIDIRNKICIYDGCIIRSTYNYKNEKIPLYCVKHKLENMIDILHKTCKSEDCNTLISNPKYQGFCLQCFMDNFPDEPITRNHKIKENFATDFIKQEFKEYNPFFDKIIQGGSSRRRPDIFMDLPTISLIGEIDEYKHDDKSYNDEDERTMEIHKDLCDRQITKKLDIKPTVIIRFNPDKYKDENGKIIKSCFKIDKASGICVIDNEAEWNKRLQTLKTIFEKYISNPPEKELTIEYLFYDTS